MKNKGVLGLVIFILVAESVLTGLIPHSRGFLFELLESKTGPIYLALGIYFSNYFFLDGFQAVKAYVILKLSLLYRTSKTHETIKSVKDDVSNSPQRIQEDIKLMYHSKFTVYAEYFISGTIVIQLLLINLSEPILVISALAYAALSVYIAVKFNPKLTATEKNVQHSEASYRTSLVDKLTDISGLEGANKASLIAEKVRTQYKLFTKLQLGVLNVLPYAVLIPSLIAGTIDLGTLIKHQATFALIVLNAAILIHYYPVLIQGKASEARVNDLTDKDL